MLFLLKQCDGELTIAIRISGSVIQGNIILEDFGDGGFFKNRLPGTFGFAGAAIDTFVGMDIELVGKLVPVVADVFIDAIHRTYANASSINAIAAEPCDSPRHVYGNLQKVLHQTRFEARRRTDRLLNRQHRREIKAQENPQSERSTGNFRT